MMITPPLRITRRCRHEAVSSAFGPYNLSVWRTGTFTSLLRMKPRLPSPVQRVQLTQEQTDERFELARQEPDGYRSPFDRDGAIVRAG
jgi:hypothetical protein